ncbi:DUF4870 domain-containing protein [Aquimarina sp. RZ0]|uniref:DUF4870 domain-containing protein n=1 Tax=Aquimarina sp. RZ0 TaxID=2607730 RepID=UPI0011F219B8|nr:DUF4870 domain-containing protein [Aquimarina sp. RZ0]KAA1247971.1 DUF4870 domain-containing protein [Aquimarina sp. RZ0]
MKREDTSLLVLLHLSGLLTGFILPLILWSTQQDKVKGMDIHGKAAVNFQLSALLYLLITMFFGFTCCIGFITLPIWFIYAYLFPIISTINASKGKLPYYPMSIRFII